MKKIVIFVLAALFLLGIRGESVAAAAEQKALYFDNADGHLKYQDGASENTAYFMVFDEMSPGEVYSDQLTIGNLSDRSYTLYLQIAPKEGTEGPAIKLLEAIRMSIAYDNQPFFEGAADFATSGAAGGLSNMISLGQFNPGEQRTLEASVSIPVEPIFKTIDQYYVRADYLRWQDSGYPPNSQPVGYHTQQEANRAAKERGETGVIYDAVQILDQIGTNEVFQTLAQTQWIFYAEQDGVMIPIRPPQTGDRSTSLLLTIGVAAACLTIILVYKKRSPKADSSLSE